YKTKPGHFFFLLLRLRSSSLIAIGIERMKMNENTIRTKIRLLPKSRISIRRQRYRRRVRSALAGRQMGTAIEGAMMHGPDLLYRHDLGLGIMRKPGEQQLDVPFGHVVGSSWLRGLLSIARPDSAVVVIAVAAISLWLGGRHFPLGVHVVEHFKVDSVLSGPINFFHALLMID